MDLVIVLDDIPPNVWPLMAMVCKRWRDAIYSRTVLHWLNGKVPISWLNALSAVRITVDTIIIDDELRKREVSLSYSNLQARENIPVPRIAFSWISLLIHDPGTVDIIHLDHGQLKRVIGSKSTIEDPQIVVIYIYGTEKMFIGGYKFLFLFLCGMPKLTHWDIRPNIIYFLPPETVDAQSRVRACLHSIIRQVEPERDTDGETPADWWTSIQKENIGMYGWLPAKELLPLLANY